ncbi:endonuclease [Aliidiomarina minuta]|uniref:Endonuclease n=2 Tax=Aliidiomarina minuta TaxID=880057 RepID=A0A432W5G4_9GAMM|nr:endonuclease [Aliidiomarina minuta]
MLVPVTVLGIVTFLPLWRLEAWWIRILDFPRLQLFFLAFAVFALQLMLLQTDSYASWGLLIFSLICVLYQSWWILPYSPLYKKEVAFSDQGAGDEALSLMIANVLTPNRNAKDLIAMLHEHKPDLLVTLESDDWWQQQLAVIEDDYTYSVKCPLDNLYGMHLYSKLPLSEISVEFLVEKDVPSIHVLIEMSSGRQVQAHFLHPAPPGPTENEESSERDAELVMVARRVQNSQLPVIVSGDLNDVAWSETTRLFRKVSGLLDPRVGRGMFNSFHAQYWFARWPLDHLFHSQDFNLKGMQRLSAFGSDHFPILTRLVLKPTAQEDQDGLEKNAEDKAWADEKLS